MDSFEYLATTSALWLPALTWLLGQLSATGTGTKIDGEIKKRLKWLKNPEAEKAFQEAFNAGIKRYRKNRAGIVSAQAVANVLAYVANHDISNMDRATILEQIFSDRIDTEAISGVVSRNIFAIEGLVISKYEISKELQRLINTYLKPAFRNQRYFVEIVGFAEVIGLLKDIKENLLPTVDLATLQKDYFSKISKKHEYITMQGISPKVQNRTIGIRMRDVFISLEARRVGGDNNLWNKIELLESLKDISFKMP